MRKSFGRTITHVLNIFLDLLLAIDLKKYLICTAMEVELASQLHPSFLKNQSHFDQ